MRLRSGEPVTVGAEGERKVLVRKGSGTMKFVAEAEAATGESGAVVVHDPALEDPSQAFQLSRLDTPEMSHVPMGIFRQVARPDLRRPGPRPGRGRHRHRGRPGHRRRPRRAAARTRHLDRRVTSAPPPETEGDGAPDAERRRRAAQGHGLRLPRLRHLGALPALLRRAEAGRRVGDPRPPHPVDPRRLRPRAARAARPRLDPAVRRPPAARRRHHHRRPAHRDQLDDLRAGRAHRAHLRGGAGLLPQPDRHRGARAWSCSASGCARCSGPRSRIGALASVYLAIAGGVLPWISLSLAFSFGLYGLTKKKVGASLEAMHSLAAETTVLAPIAVVVLVILVARGETTFLDHGTGHTSLLVLAGRGHRRAAAPLRRRRAPPAAGDRRPDPVRHAGAPAARRGARARRARRAPGCGSASASSGWRWCCSASTRCAP